ncbi:uncharacterized protein LOC120560202 isoform X2 [Perca fluviatilis]|uniref:uncharacterized protein LOC120560202 isoform X2 n=1 Tax=Perca fluviatilis TaxID=8168 RepID=UPI0019640497|nr:uncharacterized protein LOC120560202 isoform X2 [Perca fluviatilis]
MSDLEEEEDGAESVVSGCQTVKSDRSKHQPLTFSEEPGPSDTKEKRSDVSEVELSRTRTRTRAVQQTASQSSSEKMINILHEYKHKIRMKETYERVTGGADQTGSGTPINRMFTELYITDELSEEVIRGVLMIGVAGVGKTFSVQKFCLVATASINTLMSSAAPDTLLVCRTQKNARS